MIVFVGLLSPTDIKYVLNFLQKHGSQCPEILQYECITESRKDNFPVTALKGNSNDRIGLSESMKYVLSFSQMTATFSKAIWS